MANRPMIHSRSASVRAFRQAATPALAIFRALAAARKAFKKMVKNR